MTGFNAVGASFETRRRAALGPLQVPSSLLLILRSPRSGRLEGRRIFVQRRRPVLRLLALLLLAHPAFAGSLRLDGPIEQGGLVRGKAEPGAKVALDGQPVRIAPDGGFVIGFGRDAAPKAVLDLVYADGTRERRELAVAVRQYEVQRIDGLPAEQVTPDAAAEARIKREAVIIAKARAVDSDLLAFEQPFAWPAVGPISGVFGSQRILNSEARARSRSPSPTCSSPAAPSSSTTATASPPPTSTWTRSRSPSAGRWRPASASVPSAPPAASPARICIGRSTGTRCASTRRWRWVRCRRRSAESAEGQADGTKMDLMCSG
jgi:hypothetical protein